MMTSKSIVKRHYPNAIEIKNDNKYQIIIDNEIYGEGTNSTIAWHNTKIKLNLHIIKVKQN